MTLEDVLLKLKTEYGYINAQYPDTDDIDLIKDILSICQETVDEAKHPNKFKIGETVKISIASKYYEHVDRNARFKIVEIKLNQKNEIEYTLNEIGDSRTGYTDKWLDIDLEKAESPSPKEGKINDNKTI